jgi:hypothetical protein
MKSKTRTKYHANNMLNLSQIYDNFLTLFKKRKQDKSKRESPKIDYAATLSFGILESDKDTVDIKCLLPDVDTKSIEEIVDIAEKYAQLLVLINTEEFNKNISDILDNHKKNHKENYKHIMLIDNIISFWDIFYNMQTKKYYQKYKSNQPVIKPSEAFKLNK